MKYKLLLTLISVALFSQSVLAAKGGNKPVPQQNIPEPGQAVFVDANGTMLGDVQTTVEYGSAEIYFSVEDKFIMQGLYRNSTNEPTFNGGQLYYDQSGCTGNAYVPESRQFGGDFMGYSGGREGILYVSGGDTPQTVEVLSWWSDAGWSCYDFGVQICDSPERFNCLNILDVQTEPWIVDDLYPPVPIFDTNNYTKPFRLKLTPPN